MAGKLSANNEALIVLQSDSFSIDLYGRDIDRIQEHQYSATMMREGVGLERNWPLQKSAK